MIASSARQHRGASAPVDKGRISPGLSRHRPHVWLRPSLVALFRWRQKTNIWHAIASLRRRVPLRRWVILTSASAWDP